MNSADLQHHTIHYVEISVTDMTVAKEFYRAAFQWQFTEYGEEYAGIQKPGGEAGGLRRADRVETGGPLIVLYSNHLEQSLDAVRAAGGQVTVEPFSFPGGRRFQFLDPSGNELAVWSDAEVKP